MDSQQLPLIQRIDSIHQVSLQDWNACVGSEHPFLSHEFFSCLEDSGTACPRTGWQPCHLLLRREDRLLGIAPLFIKVHSEGEFVFDYSWAAAYERMGGAYYPKLQSAVPYTPVPGPRYLIHPDETDPVQARQWLRQAQLSLAESLRVSSLHITFCNQQEYGEGSQASWLPRLGIQFHFDNPGYANFEEFLAQLSARKRKAVLKERRCARESGLHLEAVSGAEIREEHVDVLYQCYQDTCSRKWGRAALTREFFVLLAERMADRVVLMLASREGRYLAAALNIRGSQSLFGRNWGALEEVPYLHFELCYYQAIDYAIQHRLQRVEAGAQGFHKVARGYLPRLTYSLHWIAQRSFRGLLSQVLEQERAEMIHQRQALEEEHSPYRKG